jgi:hypothetical protein
MIRPYTLERSWSRAAGSEIWQRGFADRYIIDVREFERCGKYVRRNPVEGRRVAREEECPYRSAHLGWALDPRPGHLSG